MPDERPDKNEVNSILQRDMRIDGHSNDGIGTFFPSAGPNRAPTGQDHNETLKGTQ